MKLANYIQNELFQNIQNNLFGMELTNLIFQVECLKLNV